MRPTLWRWRAVRSYRYQELTLPRRQVPVRGQVQSAVCRRFVNVTNDLGIAIFMGRRFTGGNFRAPMCRTLVRLRHKRAGLEFYTTGPPKRWLIYLGITV